MESCEYFPMDAAGMCQLQYSTPLKLDLHHSCQVKVVTLNTQLNKVQQVIKL